MGKIFLSTNNLFYHHVPKTLFIAVQPKKQHSGPFWTLSGFLDAYCCDHHACKWLCRQSRAYSSSFRRRRQFASPASVDEDKDDNEDEDEGDKEDEDAPPAGVFFFLLVIVWKENTGLQLLGNMHSPSATQKKYALDLRNSKEMRPCHVANRWWREQPVFY